MTGDTDTNEFTKNDAVRDVLRGAGVVYVGLVLEMGLAFIAQRFAAVYLSVSGFGNLISGTALLNVGAVLAGLGFTQGLARYLPRVERNQQRPLARYALALVIPASLVVAIPVVVFADLIARNIFSEPSLTASLRVFGAVIPFAALMNLGIGGTRGQKISRFQVYVKNIFHPGIRFVLITVAVVVGASQLGYAAGYAVPFVLAGVLAVTLFWRTLPDESDAQGARAVFPAFLRYSLPFTVSGLAGFVYRSLDIFLLLYFVGNRAVGVYGVAYALAQLIGMFSTAFDFLSTPVSSQLEKEDEIGEAISVQTTIARWLTILSISFLVPMVAFAGEFLGLIYRPAYASAAPTLAVLLIGFAFKGVLLTHTPIIEALGKSKLSAFNTTSAAVVNLVANLILIPQYGAYGAAVATTLSFAVLSVLPTIEVRYYTGKTTLNRSVFAPIFIAIPLMLAAIPVFHATPPTLLWTFGASATFALIYVVSVIIVLGFTSTDLMVIRSFEDKFDVSLGSFNTILRWFS
jgi:O-antigen/teichoic acid export membrane protein